MRAEQESPVDRFLYVNSVYFLYFLYLSSPGNVVLVIKEYSRSLQGYLRVPLERSEAEKPGLAWTHNASTRPNGHKSG
jgi:hypothetical protein